METLHRIQVLEATEKMGREICDQLIHGGSLILFINKKIVRVIRQQDLKDKEGKMSFFCVSETLRDNPNSDVRFTIIDPNKRLVASYRGHTKNVLGS
jgi:hypothetical protein